MSARKKHSLRLRIENSARSLVKLHHAAIVDVEVGTKEWQIMLQYKSCRQIRNVQVAHAMCDLPHIWTIYMSVFCRSLATGTYSKSIEFSPPEQYLLAELEPLMLDKHADLVAQANKAHIIGSGWIAIPNDISLTEAEADQVFTAMGVWQQAAA